MKVNVGDVCGGIASIATTNRFSVAARDVSPFHAAGVNVINAKAKADACSVPFWLLPPNHVCQI